MVNKFNEDTPVGLQKKFYFLASYELAWRGGIYKDQDFTILFINNIYLLPNRSFLTPNPFWKKERSAWFKNCPVGHSKILIWTKEEAQAVGVDTKTRRIANYLLRSTAVSHLSKAGVGEQELIKITEHGSSSSIQPYLQMDLGHHEQKIIEKFQNLDKRNSP
ncbi:hypothetical protein ILUMI_01391 [Ignelater luminosus]|uniref:Tyr recombinase domain-containing protein n=1 Tax=Ignelater luminosus TaxID=2038154 RepID=A0A8K0DQT7_IGNLU|nr:hypothetical protein ILUMI_01391 [Ignelater luminosus]